MILTDLKAAYLLAFASLGYSFCAEDSLRPLRAVLRGEIPPDPMYGYLSAIDILGPNMLDAVIEVAAPDPAIIVRSHAGAAAVLPFPGTSLPFGGTWVSQVRWRPWPKLYVPQGEEGGGHQLVDEARQKGWLFHADFCKKPHWPVTAALR